MSAYHGAGHMAPVAGPKPARKKAAACNHDSSVFCTFCMDEADKVPVPQYCMDAMQGDWHDSIEIIDKKRSK